MTHINNSLHEVHPAAHSAAVALIEKEELKIRAKRGVSDKSALTEAKKEEKSSVASYKLEIPAPMTKKPEERDYLRDLIESYCTITEVTGDTTQAQMNEFGQLQSLDLTMSQIILAKQKDYMDKLQAYDVAVQKQKDAEEKAATGSLVCSIITWVAMGLMVAMTLGEALPAAAAYFSEAISTSIVEGATSQLLAEAGVEAGAEAAANAASSAAEAVSANVGVEAGEGVEAAELNAEMSAPAVKPINLDIARKGVTFFLSAALGAPQIYEGYVSACELAPIKREVAECQRTIGGNQGELKILQGAQSFYQKEAERLSSTLTSLGDELGEETETAADTLSVYNQITQGIGQRRA